MNIRFTSVDLASLDLADGDLSRYCVSIGLVPFMVSAFSAASISSWPIFQARKRSMQNAAAMYMKPVKI